MKENGPGGLAVKVIGWLKQLEAAGAPIWFRKIHGSPYQRDIPDVLLCIEEKFVAIELKSPDNPTPPTPGQKKELARITKAKGRTLVSHDLAEVQTFVSRELHDTADWVHTTLTEPYL